MAEKSAAAPAAPAARPKGKRAIKRRHDQRIDSATAAGLQEMYKKEERALWRYLQMLEAAGKLDGHRPPPKGAASAAAGPRLGASKAGKLRQAQRAAAAGQSQPQQPPAEDKELAAALERCSGDTPTGSSRSLWAPVNPGYWLPASLQAEKTRQEADACAALEAALQAEARRLDGDFRKQRNDLTEHMEAAAAWRRTQAKPAAAAEARAGKAGTA